MHCVMCAMVLLLGVSAFFSLPALAGDLDGFDRAATQNHGARDSGDKSAASKSNSSGNADASPSNSGDMCDDITQMLGCIFFELPLEMTFETLFGDPVGSMVQARQASPADTDLHVLSSATVARMHPGYTTTAAPQTPVPPRLPGDYLLPFFRFDGNGQEAGHNIRGDDYLLESGYGPYAVQARKTFFHEGEPSERLTLSEYDFLTRFSTTASFEFDFGLGATTVDGLEYAGGPNMLLVFRGKPQPWLGLELRGNVSSVNGNMLLDEDANLVLLHRDAGLRLGYRRQHVASETLQGPYLGLSWYY